MASEKQLKQASRRSIEKLAQELSSSVQLSFAEPLAGAFFHEARAAIARTRKTYQTLVKNLTEHVKGTPGVETLLDNSHMIAGALSEMTVRWRRKETLRLPQTVDDTGKRRPRVYLIAQALVRQSDVRIDREAVALFLQDYQSRTPLSVRELDIFPDMLRFALIEEISRTMETIYHKFVQIEEAERWLARMTDVIGKRDAERELAALTNQLAQEHKVIPVHFGFHLLQRIAQSGRERDLRVVSRRLKVSLARQGVGAGRLPETVAKSERELAVVIDRDIAGLHWLGQMRWDKISLSLNAVDAVLSRDPAGLYAELTDDTRAAYRRAVVRIADRTSAHDVEIAREALRLARAARIGARIEERDRLSHVGYYLVGDGILALERAFHYEPTAIERLRRTILAHATASYLGVVFTVTAAILGLSFLTAGDAVLPVWTYALLGVAGLILASEIAVAVAHLLFTRVLPPRPLPQLDCRRGVGESRRTVVVVPSFVRDERSTARLLSRMETNFIANRDPDVYFAALLDFRDADAERLPEDDAALAVIREGIARLNQKHPSGTPRFSVFCRKRIWNASEGAFMGWERKRGKLREFNGLLRGEPTSFGGDAVEAAAKLGRVRYVLTIDEDTELTRDSALALIGTIDHPLNRPVIDPRRRVVTAGYGIVMPRSALRFSEGTASAFSRVFGGVPGIEAYSSAVSDLHQDLFGEAVFQGKGIYDIDAVETTMRGRIPENTVLSHDLLEGLYARTGTATNAFIFEGFPSTFRTYMMRAHRWIRGDWQIIGWLFPRRGRVLSAIGKWRIADNLRRSLLPIALFFAVTSASFSPANSLYWSALSLAALGAGQLLPVFARMVGMMTALDRRLTLGYRVGTSAAEISAAVAKTLLLGIFALQSAVVSADAVMRSMWRLLASKRKLLEWQPAYEAAGGSVGRFVGGLRPMWPSILISSGIVIANFMPGMKVDRLSFLWATAWVAAPAVGAAMSGGKRKSATFAPGDAAYLRGVAAKTYWFFVDMVNKGTRWLPPDHLQEEPVSKRHSHGLGVSPTNLGMYLLSLSAARALGLTTVTEYAARIREAFRSMSRMERHRGHFFNWYDLRSLTPLAPRYVSSVDSANLALAFLATRNALLEACDEPLLSRATFEGFDAQLAVLSEWSTKMMSASKSDSAKRRLIRDVIAAVAQSRALVKRALDGDVTARESDLVYSGAVHHAVRIRNTLEALRMEEGSFAFEHVFLAARKIEALAVENRDLLGQYFGYATVPAVSAVAEDDDLRASYAHLFETLAAIPSLNGLADGKTREVVEGVGFIEAVDRSTLPAPEKDRVRTWYGEILARLGAAEAKAREIRDRLLSAAASAREYFDDMDFSFLYDEERGLFHMGYYGSRDFFDDIFYDLFASEANSVSIVGISKRDAPKEHWSYLSRKLVRSADGSATPVSWAGSLFEYLGTLLFFDISSESFWGVAAQRAVAAHRSFARRHGIPWGMGESASSSMDASENFHYQAFGEPSIGFKRNLSDSVVVAPYTTALSLPIAPHAAVRNFRQLDRVGASGRYGFYDAVDYTAKVSGENDAGVPVPIYYAHHQGFILSSIANAIHSGWVRRMTEFEPDMRAATQLFEEKMPDVPPVEPLRALLPSRPAVDRLVPDGDAPRRYVSARTKEARWEFLSNGSYRIALSNAGAGDSQYEDVSITRRSDGIDAEMRGTFHYLFDRERGAMWSPTFLPTQTIGEKSSVSIGGQVATFEKVYEGIESILRVAVDPGSPVEVRELTLTNRRSTLATLTVGACAEVSLARPLDAMTHQNYQNLFLASEPAFEGSGAIISRSDSRRGDRPVAAGFFVTTPDGRPDDLRLARDRETFYGPVIDRAEPLMMKDPARATSALPAHTLDTAFGFAATVSLRPGETRRVALVVGVGESGESVQSALRPYRKYRHVRASIIGAAAVAVSGITHTQAETYDTIASMLTARKDRASAGLQADRPPLVDVLWKCGISGVRPIVLTSVYGLTDLPLVRQMIACHTYFLRKGVEADIVILNEHRGGYLKTLEEEIDFLLRVHGDTGRSRDCVIHHVRGEELDVRDVRAMRVAATVVIDAVEGTLFDQVRAQSRVRSPELPPPLAPADAPKARDHAAVSRKWSPTDPTSLEHWNGIGGYDAATGAYVILPKDGVMPPAPWSNVVANEHLGFLTTDRGTTFSWARNSRENKLTKAYNDPLSPETAESFYVRDDATGDSFSPLPAVGKRDARYEIRYGQGYSEFRTHQGGLKIRLTMHVAPSAPIKYCSLTVKNESGDSRKLTLFGYFELLLGSFPHETKRQLAFSAREGNTLVVQNAYRNTFTESRAFLGIIGGAERFTTSKEEFIGRFGSLSSPAALSRQGLSSRIVPDGEPAAALSTSAVLAPGEERTATFFLGEANAGEALEFLLRRAGDPVISGNSLDEAIASWRAFPKLSFELPDATLALLCNRFLPYQTVASRLHGRTGFHQIGGAFGFRDQLQDVLSLLWHDPTIARSHILSCAARQFAEGDVLSWWHPHNDFGARTMISDQHLWLPYAVSRYVAFTGDAGILDVDVPYLAGEVPDMEHRSVVGVFHAGQEHGTVYDHCIRAVERALTWGAHGLPLIGAADWNDGMNRVGPEGRGESVWLAWLTVMVLREMADLAAARGDDERVVRYRDDAQSYLEAIERFAWDGNWFRRAYTDAGVPVGTQSGKTWRIDSVTQSWAAFVLGKTPETESALRSAQQEFHVWEGHVPLAVPPSNPDLLDLGTLSDYPPGVRENAGQYNHAAIWLAKALFRVGDADAGKAVIDAVNPFKRSATPEKATIYRGEPYAIAADIYSSPTYPGRAGWTWYTASAGALYRTVVEYLLGMTVLGNRLSFRPVLPSDWDQATVRYTFKTSSYVIRYVVDRSGPEDRPTRVTFDGNPADSGTIPLLDDGKTHEVIVTVVRAKKAS